MPRKSKGEPVVDPIDRIIKKLKRAIQDDAGCVILKDEIQPLLSRLTKKGAK